MKGELRNYKKLIGIKFQGMKCFLTWFYLPLGQIQLIDRKIASN